MHTRMCIGVSGYIWQVWFHLWPAFFRTLSEKYSWCVKPCLLCQIVHSFIPVFPACLPRGYCTGWEGSCTLQLSPGWETAPKNCGEVARKSVQKCCWFRWRGKCSSWPVSCSVKSNFCPECSCASLLDRGDAAGLFKQDSLFLPEQTLSPTLWKAWPDLDWEAWWNINIWCLLNIVNILPRRVNK